LTPLPQAGVEPGPADLDDPVGGPHGEVATAADELAAAPVTGGEDSLPALGRSRKARLQPAVEVFAAGADVGQPLPDLGCLRRSPQTLGVRLLERLEHHQLALEPDRQILHLAILTESRRDVPS
jgi:hypothetical protein